MTLRKQLGEIAVSVDGEPAVLELDGLGRGATPLDGPLYVLPGRHRIAATREDETAHTEVEVHRGERVPVALVLVAPAAAAWRITAEPTTPTDQPAVERTPTLTPVPSSPPRLRSSAWRSDGVSSAE